MEMPTSCDCGNVVELNDMPTCLGCGDMYCKECLDDGYCTRCVENFVECQECGDKVDELLEKGRCFGCNETIIE